MINLPLPDAQDCLALRRRDGAQEHVVAVTAETTIAADGWQQRRLRDCIAMRRDDGEAEQDRADPLRRRH